MASSVIYTFKDYGENDIVNKNIVTKNKYEMINADSNIIIFDKETGRYWRKYINTNEGPNEWTEETIDLLNK
ncbi:hypothetical protein [Clostridium sp.]|uniref:hypothetical protein n=1 Tax=Clostridium sp. TaxID=1506 RepID=UPI001A3EF7B7|nr:hypothetical protein [Clostridium sp.]MBK5243090.1 hypothetical protein [Clostridium sp.]